MGSLKNWLQSRNEENVMAKVLGHMQKVLECVVEFERGFGFYADEKDSKLALEVFQRVDVLEHDADKLRRELLMLISKSEFVPRIREDLTTLVKRIDRIANTSDGASRRLSGIDENHIRSLGDEFLKAIEKMVHKSVEATKILFNLIKKLVDITDQEVFRITEQIQKLEHECDILHSSTYEYLVSLPEVSFNPFIAIQISNFVDMIETISDKVEDVADYIEVLKTAKR